MIWDVLVGRMLPKEEDGEYWETWEPRISVRLQDPYMEWNKRLKFGFNLVVCLLFYFFITKLA